MRRARREHAPSEGEGEGGGDAPCVIDACESGARACWTGENETTARDAVSAVRVCICDGYVRVPCVLLLVLCVHSSGGGVGGATVVVPACVRGSRLLCTVCRRWVMLRRVLAACVSELSYNERRTVVTR